VITKYKLLNKMGIPIKQWDVYIIPIGGAAADYRKGIVLLPFFFFFVFLVFLTPNSQVFLVMESTHVSNVSYSVFTIERTPSTKLIADLSGFEGRFTEIERRSIKGKSPNL